MREGGRASRGVLNRVLYVASIVRRREIKSPFLSFFLSFFFFFLSFYFFLFFLSFPSFSFIRVDFQVSEGRWESVERFVKPRVVCRLNCWTKRNCVSVSFFLFYSSFFFLLFFLFFLLLLFLLFLLLSYEWIFR